MKRAAPVDRALLVDEHAVHVHQPGADPSTGLGHPVQGTVRPGGCCSTCSTRPTTRRPAPRDRWRSRTSSARPRGAAAGCCAGGSLQRERACPSSTSTRCTATRSTERWGCGRALREYLARAAGAADQRERRLRRQAALVPADRAAGGGARRGGRRAGLRGRCRLPACAAAGRALRAHRPAGRRPPGRLAVVLARDRRVVGRGARRGRAGAARDAWRPPSSSSGVASMQHAGGRDRRARPVTAASRPHTAVRAATVEVAGHRPGGQRAGDPVGRGLLEPVGGEHGVEDAHAGDQPELDDHHEREPERAGADEGQAERPARAQRPGDEQDRVAPEARDEPRREPRADAARRRRARRTRGRTATARTRARRA